jgi:hypothetical protein
LRALKTADSLSCTNVQGVPSKLADIDALLGDVVGVEVQWAWTDADAGVGGIISVVAVRAIQGSHAKVFQFIAIEVEGAG